MLRYMKFLAALFALASVRCAPAEPCSPGNEDPDEWGPTTLPSPGPGGPTDPGIDPGESDGDAFGYRRQADGDLCACDWLEREEGGCSQDPVEKCGSGVPKDVTTGECVNELQYHGGKKDPPAPAPPPGSGMWLCTTECKCTIAGGNRINIITTGENKDEREARALSIKNWGIASKKNSCIDYPGYGWLWDVSTKCEEQTVH